MTDKTSMTKCMSIDEIKEKLEKVLTPKRFEHSIHVMEAARMLAERFGEDVDRAELAGLIHDCARDMKKGDTLELCCKYGIAPDDIMKDQPELLHGPVGSHLAKELFGVEDSRVLAAVADHTMGCEGMDKLCRIVFIADYIEAGRSYPGVESIRKAAEESLEKAIVAGLDNTIGFIVSKGGLLHPQTINTRNWALELLKKETER